MNCLESLIKIREYCDPNVLQDSNVLYFEDLDLTIALIAQLANLENHETAKDVILDKIRQASVFVKSELLALLYQNNIEIKEHYNNYVTSSYYNPYQYHQVANKNRGLRIENTTCECPLTKIYIHSLTLLISNNDTVTLTVTDGAYSLNYTVDLVANQTKVVEIGYTANTNIIYITLNNSLINTAVTKINSLGGGCCGKKTNSKLKIEGWNGDSVDSSSYGIVGNVSLVCDIEALICFFKHKLKEVLLYKVGVLILDYALTTQRLNSFTLNTEHIVKLKKIYQDKYELFLKQFVTQNKAAITNFDKCCIKCIGLRQSFQIM